MIDREKVIKALACCVFPVSKGFPYQSHIADEGCEVYECPYQGDCDQMLLDVLELLKEQKSLKPYIDSFNDDCWWATECCGTPINFKTDKFCPKCGRPIKWDV